MNKFIKTIALVALFCGFSSCNQDNEGSIYNPNSEEVSFYTNILTCGLLPSQNNIIVVPVARSNRGPAASVGEFVLDSVYQVVNGKGKNISSQNLFVLKSSQASFSDGSGEGSLQFSYADINTLDASSVYNLYISNKSKSISPSDISRIKVSAQRVLTYAFYADAVYTTSAFGARRDIKVEKANEADFYNILDAYTNGFHLNLSVAPDGTISMDPQAIGQDIGDGMIYVATSPKVKSYKDGNVFYLNLDLLVKIGNQWGTYGNFKESCTLNK